MSLDNANDGIRMFAKSAIGGASLINSGALIATLSQLPKLREIIDLQALQWAFSCWGVGLAIATICWLFGWGAASAFANGKRGLEIGLGIVGGFLVLVSIMMFVAGIFSIGHGIKDASTARHQAQSPAQCNSCSVVAE